MKFALLTTFWPHLNNFGGHAQTMAIEQLYNCMGVPQDDIVHLRMCDLVTYDGEPVILPWNYAPVCFPTNPQGKVVFSDKITPVFIGASLLYLTLAPFKFSSLDHFMTECGGRELLLKYAPIGCRDETSRGILQAWGIPAYLQGCITSTFSRRHSGDYKKILLIDCLFDIIKYIPEHLREYVEVVTNEGFLSDLDGESAYQVVKQKYAYMRDNAALIVSGRFHVATPCYAMGIPTILVERSPCIAPETMVNASIPFYRHSDFHKIDWNPQCESYEDTKQIIANLAMARIKTAGALAAASATIPALYQTDNSRFGWKSIVNRGAQIKSFISCNFPAQTKGRFFVWGAEKHRCEYGRCVLADYVVSINPNLVWAGWIDCYKEGLLCQAPIYSPAALVDIAFTSNDFIIIAEERQLPQAIKSISELGLNSRNYIIATPPRNLVESDLEIYTFLRKNFHEEVAKTAQAPAMAPLSRSPKAAFAHRAAKLFFKKEH